MPTGASFENLNREEFVEFYSAGHDPNAEKPKSPILVDR